MRSFEYHKPKTLDQAWKLMEQHPGARFIAGGTDVMVQLHRGAPRPPALISLRSIDGLAGVTPGELTRIGGLTPIADIVKHAHLQEVFPLLVQAAGRLGSPQVRNVATVGGNLCNASPCADTAPPLLVLEARAELEGPDGKREIPLEELFENPGETRLGPREVLTAILVPRPPAGARGTFLKKGRVQMDLSLASVAALLELSEGRCRRVRLAAGSVGPTPMRLRPVEELLEGQALTPALLAEAQRLAARAVSPITDLRTTEAYRRQIVGVYLRRCLEELS